MGINENIAAVRADANNLSQAFYIHFFKQFPQHQNRFPDFKGKSAAELKGIAKFGTHPLKVVSMLLTVVENSGDAGALKADGQKIAKMPQHAGLGAQEYNDLFTALVSFLQEKLGGSCDTAAWQKAGSAISAAIVAAK